MTRIKSEKRQLGHRLMNLKGILIKRREKNYGNTKRYDS